MPIATERTTTVNSVVLGLAHISLYTKLGNFRVKTCIWCVVALKGVPCVVYFFPFYFIVMSQNDISSVYMHRCGAAMGWGAHPISMQHSGLNRVHRTHNPFVVGLCRLGQITAQGGIEPLDWIPQVLDSETASQTWALPFML